MELATAGTLRDQLGPNAPARPLDQRLADVNAVVAGLAAIHGAGIVHRDVKPDNFLRMDDGRLVLSDFGLATNPGEAPAVSIMVGTPHYMAPEVVMGEPATSSSDIWAAGVAIHEILFGSRPERSATARAQSSKSSALSTRVEKALLEVCLPCLEDEPDDRPANGTELFRSIEKAVTAPLRFRLGRSRSMHTNAVWGAIAMATIALSVGLGKRFWQPAQAGSAVLPAASLPAITIADSPQDWSRVSKTIRRFESRVHCFALLPGGEVARVVSGTPRRAENIDLATGKAIPSSLPAETYQVDCPQLSPKGDQLLFSRLPNGSSPQIVRALGDGTSPVTITNGSEPIWLPDGEEFLFSVDAAHAGVFSLPTMSYTLLPDSRGESKRHLYRKAVSPDGTSIVLVYNGDSVNRVLEMHSLPGLTLTSAWQLPFSIQNAQFHGRGLLLADASGRGTLARLDLQSGEAHRLGYIPGQALDSVVPLPNGDTLALSKVRSSDVWIYGPGKAPRQLTRDGRNYGASASNLGDVLVARQLDDNRFVIFRYDRDGNGTQVTSGPSDCVPSFASDGSTWLYSDYHRKAIVECGPRGCSDIWQDALLPAWPVMAPDMRHIAFVTANGTPRLHVINRDGGRAFDLGSTAVECPPVWTSAASLWGYSGAGTARRWDEIDIATGKKTGRSKLATAFDLDTQTCDSVSEPPDSPFYRGARIVSHETWEARRSSRFPGLD
jgi:serine/threonine protein kinase